MVGVEQEIVLLIDDRAGNLEHCGICGGDPGISGTLHQSARRTSAPLAGQIGGVKFFDQGSTEGHAPEDIGFQDFGGLQVN